MWKNFRGSNLSGRILGRNLNLSDFAFEERGRRCKFSENFGVKKGGNAARFFFQCLRAVRHETKFSAVRSMQFF